MSAQLEAGNPALDSVMSEPSYTYNGNVNMKNESEKDTSEATDTRETDQPLTLIPTKSSFRDDPPPDGGLKAWTQALAGHLVVSSTWGSISSFGVFQAYYVTALGRPPSDISWVGSVQVMLLFFIGTFSGRATDGGYYRHTFLAGAFMVVFGIMMTSISTQYWQLFLAQGICQGLGNGLLFCPMISLVSTYFHKKRAFAISLAACGGATGGMVFPAIVESLLPKIGFGWTVRVIGFVVVFNLTIVCALARTRIRPRKTGPIIEWSAFKELPYLLFSIGSFLLYLGVYFVYFYVTPFSRDILGVSQSTSISLLIVLNAVGIPGRIVPAFLADRYFGPMNLFIPTVLSAGLLVYCWIAVHDLSAEIVFIIFYGYFGAGLQSLFPATLSSLTTDLKKMGVRIGMVFSISSIAVLLGSPIGGALIQLRNGDYLYAQIFGGTSLVCGSILLVGARIAQTGLTLKKRM